MIPAGGPPVSRASASGSPEGGPCCGETRLRRIGYPRPVMSQPTEPTVASGAGLVCDFCGQRSGSVRRVALDRGYDRLKPSTRELYACPPCSEAKEKARKGLPPR